MPGALQQALLLFLVATEAGGHLAEGSEGVGRTPIGSVEQRLDPPQFVAKPGVLADQHIEFRFDLGPQAVQRREVHLFLQREMRIERTVEAAERELLLLQLAALEDAQRGDLECVEITVLAGDAPRLVGEAEAESGLVGRCHVARNSTAVL